MFERTKRVLFRHWCECHRTETQCVRVCLSLMHTIGWFGLAPSTIHSVSDDVLVVCRGCD